MENVIETFESITKSLRAFLPERIRPFSKEARLSERGVFITGVRGVGKTVFALYKMPDNALYIAADHPILSGLKLFDVVERIFKEGYYHVVIDEIHNFMDWAKDVKVLYDLFPRKSLWLIDSNSALPKAHAADLSRRFPKFKVPLLSFREYLNLKYGLDYPVIDPFSPDEKFMLDVLRKVDILPEFNQYLSGGTRPFFLEGMFREKLFASIEKSIHFDIPYLVPSIKENHFHMMKAVIRYLLYSPAPTVNIEKLSREFAISKPKMYQLLQAMSEVDLISIVRRERDFSAFSKGAKMFLKDFSLYFTMNANKGSGREAFVNYCLSMMGDVFACKDERICDFVINGMKMEVGGKSKGKKGSDIVVSFDIELPVKNKIPAWILAMGW